MLRVLFKDCADITEIDLSNLDTSEISRMDNIFNGCLSLTSVILDNIDTTKIKHIESMFKNCTNLEYINLKPFNNRILTSVSDIFEGIPENMVVCTNNNQIITELKKKKCGITYCLDNWKLIQQNIFDNNIYCFNDKQLIEFKKLISCKFLTYKELCSNCSSLSNYFPKEDDLIDIEQTQDTFCYKELKGYYLDTKTSLYKKCYQSCETCETKGNNTNHNCLKCNRNFNFEMKFYNYSNCYEKCPYYYYIDNNNNSICLNDYICPDEYPKLIENKSECIKDDKNIYESTFIDREY